jgi:hypothetical protein
MEWKRPVARPAFFFGAYRKNRNGAGITSAVFISLGHSNRSAQDFVA